MERNKNLEFLDLGCGSGKDTLYLKENGYNVIACDYSEEALDIVRNNIKNVEIMNFDMSEKFPFNDEKFPIIIADLSIHYFSEKDTFKILDEVKRILKDDGYFICRVNSVNDYNYGAGEGEEIEKNYYKTKNGNKRFFDRDSINFFF